MTEKKKYSNQWKATIPDIDERYVVNINLPIARRARRNDEMALEYSDMFVTVLETAASSVYALALEKMLSFGNEEIKLEFILYSGEAQVVETWTIVGTVASVDASKLSMHDSSAMVTTISYKITSVKINNHFVM